MKKTYKCKGCGGHLFFNPETNDLECEYCKNHFNIDNKPNDSRPIKLDYSPDFQYQENQDAAKIFECKSEACFAVSNICVKFLIVKSSSLVLPKL